MGPAGSSVCYRSPRERWKGFSKHLQLVGKSFWGVETGKPMSPIPGALSWLRCWLGEVRGWQLWWSHPEIYAHGGYERPGEKGSIFEPEQEAGFPHA